MNTLVVLYLFILGLALGSFVNALVWRLRQQLDDDGVPKKLSKSKRQALSISKGRSMCPHCKHQLAAFDLVPVFSWLALRGKCRYCHKPISPQYPTVELATALLFVASYLLWPSDLQGRALLDFVVWLPILVGFVALFVYDLRWWLLPNKIVIPLIILAAVNVLAGAVLFDGGTALLLDAGLSVLVAGGLFYFLFQISNGKWIGGGDVKLGLLIGLVLGEPSLALLMLFTASLLGTLVALPGLISKRLSRTSKLPFGPFLIVAAIIAKLFGTSLTDWYLSTLTTL